MNFHERFLFTVILISLFSKYGNPVILKIQNDNKRALCQLLDPIITKIIDQHSNDKTGITVIAKDSRDAHFKCLISQIMKAKLTNGIYSLTDGHYSKIPRTRANIILLKSSDEKFNNELFSDKTTVDTRSTIILIFTDQPKKSFHKKILRELWKNGFINVLTSFIDEHQLFFISYNDFFNMFETFRGIEYNKSIFKTKTIDLNKNPINVLFTFNDHTKIRKTKDFEHKKEKYEGKDFDIITTIFENLNANLSVIDIDDTIPDPSENPWFSSLEMENKSEVQREILKAWNITMLTKSQRVLENDGVIEVTYPHTDNAVTLLLPKRKKITKVEEAYNYLMQPVWLIHLSVFASLALVMSIVRKISGMPFGSTPTNQLFRIMFTCSSYGFSEKTFEALLLLAWIFGCFIASIMAQAKITSMLSTDMYEPELDSLEDVYRKGSLDFIIFGLTSYIDELAEKYEGSKYMRVISDMVKVPMDENMGEIMLLDMPKPKTFQMSIVLEHDIAKFYARHLKNRVDGAGRPLLHMMKHSLMPCFQVFHVTAGSPLLPTINRKIRQLVEGGFIDLFKQRFLFKGLIDGYLYPDEDYDIDNYQPEPIDMELTKHALCLLYIGLSISTVCFIIEVLIFGVTWILEKLKSRNIVHFISAPLKNK